MGWDGTGREGKINSVKNNSRKYRKLRGCISLTLSILSWRLDVQNNVSYEMSYMYGSLTKMGSVDRQ